MSALFDFKAFLTVVLLTICTCTYIKAKFPSLLNDRTGFRGLFWKAARIGKQCQQETGLCCPYPPWAMPLITRAGLQTMRMHCQWLPDTSHAKTDAAA